MTIKGTGNNSGKSDFSVHTGGTATMALSGAEFRVGADDVNWSVAVRSNGAFQTYGQNAILQAVSGDRDVVLCPSGTGKTSMVGNSYSSVCACSPIVCATSCVAVAGTHAQQLLANSSNSLTIRNSANTNTGGLVLQGSSGTHGMQLYWAGNAYGFLDGAWAGWDIRKAVNGNLEAWVGGSGFICACEGGLAAATCVKIGDAVNLSQFNNTGTRLKICGTGDNSMYIGPNNDDSWGYIYSTNNSAGIYFGLNQGNFLFDTGSLGSYTDAEVDVGYSGRRFRCGWFSSNICAQGCVNTPVICATNYVNAPEFYSCGFKFYNLNYNSSSDRGPWNPIVSSIRGSGRRVYYDEDFHDGNNSVGVYNNAGGTAVTITRVDMSAEGTNCEAPNNSGQALRVCWDGGSTSPNRGGVIQTISSARNKTFAQIFQACLPSNANLHINENAQGSNSRSYWLTNNSGTGKWEWYARISHAGNSGTFSSGGHISVSGPSSAFKWYIGSMTVYDVTDASRTCEDVIQAACCVYAPSFCGSSCVRGGCLCATSTITGDSGVYSPIICGTTCVRGGVFCATTCMCTPCHCANDFKAHGWFRNAQSNHGLYNEVTSQHWYSDDNDWWNLAGGGACNGI